MKHRNRLLEQLKALLPAEFEEVVFRYQSLHPANLSQSVGQVQNALELIRHAEAGRQLEKLWQALRDVKPARVHSAAETQNFSSAGINGKSDFSAHLGHEDAPGLLPLEERLKQIRAGHNPYVPGDHALPANSPVFVGRARELHEIRAGLRRIPPACISLLGERRIGKSSLLRQVVQSLRNEPGLVTIFGDAQHWNHAGQENFFQHLHAALCRALDDTRSTPITDYAGLHHYLCRLAPHYRFVLIIDEFEQMTANPRFDAGFFTNLRALANDDACNTGYLLASRRPLQKLCEQHKIESSAFWNIFGLPYTLGLLAPPEAERLFTVPLARSLRRKLNAQGIHKLRFYTSHHPALIQMALDHVWSAWAGGFSLDRARLELGLRGFYTALWQPRSPPEIALLRKLAAGKAVERDFTFSELRQRGLIGADGQVFSGFFRQLIGGELT